MATSLQDGTSSPNLDPEKSTMSSGEDKALPRTMADANTCAVDNNSLRSAEAEDILARQALDPALNMKMHLVNNVSCLHSPYHMGRGL